jgi:hypothetical protein
LAHLSIYMSEMLRELLHIDQIKSLAEGTFNCWLSYTMSQPVQFDLAILACLVLQYVGINHFLVKRNEGSSNLSLE